MSLFEAIRNYMNGEIINPSPPPETILAPIQKEIEVDEDRGEIICPRCEGRGAIDVARMDGSLTGGTCICDKCWGKGKLDWIEQATGVEPPNYYGSSGTSGSVGVSGFAGTSGVMGPNGQQGTSGTDLPYLKGTTELGFAVGNIIGGVMNGR